VPAPARICALVAAHERPWHTEKALDSLFDAASRARVDVEVILADSSRDSRTAEVVRAKPESITFLKVAANCFWACAMRRASEEASSREWDYLLWLNDDVELHPDALLRIVSLARRTEGRALVAGTLVDPRDGLRSYGIGRLGPWYRRLHLSQVQPTTPWSEGHVANGNVLLLPRQITDQLGCFPDGFFHNQADIAFSLSAWKAGWRVVTPGEPVGLCVKSPDWDLTSTIDIGPLGPIGRSGNPKGLRLSEWIPFALKFGGVFGFLFAFSPVFVGIFSRARSRRGRPSVPPGQDDSSLDLRRMP